MYWHEKEINNRYKISLEIICTDKLNIFTITQRTILDMYMGIF